MQGQRKIRALFRFCRLFSAFLPALAVWVPLGYPHEFFRGVYSGGRVLFLLATKIRITRLVRVRFHFRVAQIVAETLLYRLIPENFGKTRSNLREVGQNEVKAKFNHVGVPNEEPPSTSNHLSSLKAFLQC